MPHDPWRKKTNDLRACHLLGYFEHRKTHHAGMMLMQRRPGMYLCMNCKQSAESLRMNAGNADRLIILDGCADCCATKKLAAAGLSADVDIIATEPGIEKNGMADVQYDEIEKVIRPVMNGGGP